MPTAPITPSNECVNTSGKMSPYSVESLIRLIHRLRGKNGCPWDRQQTPRTMVRYLTEETGELVEAIENDDPDEVCEELGDVLFQILFVAVLFQEMGHFDLTDIIRLNLEKMIRRHPHVFGNETVNGVEDVKHRWQQIKMEEKKGSSSRQDENRLNQLKKIISEKEETIDGCKADGLKKLCEELKRPGE